MFRLRRHVSYANVVATLALVLALGMGGAYALDRIGSPQIKNNSIRSIDLRDGRAVRGVDVKPNSLGRKQVNEESLVAADIAPVDRGFQIECALEPEFSACVEASVVLPRRGRLLAIATGSLVTESEGVAGAKAECEFVSNGTPMSSPIFFGEPGDATDFQQGDGFAHTFLSPDRVDAADYKVGFACREVDGEIMLEEVSLVAVALTSR